MSTLKPDLKARDGADIMAHTEDIPRSAEAAEAVLPLYDRFHEMHFLFEQFLTVLQLQESGKMPIPRIEAGRDTCVITPEIMCAQSEIALGSLNLLLKRELERAGLNSDRLAQIAEGDYKLESGEEQLLLDFSEGPGLIEIGNDCDPVDLSSETPL